VAYGAESFFDLLLTEEPFSTQISEGWGCFVNRPE
jgi:hypothetical protein